MEQKLLNRQEAAKYLHISVRTLDTLIKEGKLTSVRIGRKVLLDVADLDEFIEQQKTSAQQ